MSLPGLGVGGRINRRSERLEVEFLDENLKKQRRKLNNFDAVVFEHEYDHIDGIMFIDFLTEEQKREIAPKLLAIENKEVYSNYSVLYADGTVRTKEENLALEKEKRNLQIVNSQPQIVQEENGANKPKDINDIIRESNAVPYKRTW